MHEVRANVRVYQDGDHAVVTFTKGNVQLGLRFPVASTEADHDDIDALVFNIEPLIESANLELEAAALRQEMGSEQ